jgi:hypothetical protein
METPLMYARNNNRVDCIPILEEAERRRASLTPLRYDPCISSPLYLKLL